MMNTVYIYKLTTDNGGAPCVRDKILSLALCKPAIRTSAKTGNVILGFAANSLYSDNCLIYAAEVKKPVLGSDYYFTSEFEHRLDCIYRWDGSDYHRRGGAKYHLEEDDLAHDLGDSPAYRRARVLVCNKFRYFKDACPIDYKRQYPRLAALVEKLGVGHRVNFNAELRSEIEQLVRQVWRTESTCTETPVPTSPCPGRCD